MFSKCWKNLELGTNKLKLDFKLLPTISFRHYNIQREIDLWNRRQFGANWNATVPNSVTPIKPIVSEWIYMSQGWYWWMTHKLHVYQIFIRIFVKLRFREFFVKFMTTNAYLCRLAQQDLNVSYETSIFRSILMVHKILIKTIILKKWN